MSRPLVPMTSPPNPNPRAPTAEYVILMALLISIGAMGTDIMLPALDVIGEELGVGHANDVHYIVTAFFLGMAVGQLFVGPLSDSFGRKPVIYGGYGVFVLGCVLSMITESWTVMLAGRMLQGVGAAAPRIVALALVRDEFEGRPMARVMSMIMGVFIIVPIIAPAVGQGLIHLGDWTWTFGSLAITGILVSIWFGLRQPETLPPSDRRPFRAGHIWNGVGEILRTRSAFGYTVALGFTYGMFVGYLGSAQHIFQDAFRAGDLFVVYFAIAAAAIGIASLVNASLVMRLGMRRLAGWALIALTGASFLFWGALPIYGGVPPLAMFLVWQLAAFFCVGLIFGNLNALAMEPLGHMAGLGAAFVGSLATFISLPLASLIGNRFDGTVFPMVAGFAVLGLAACATMVWTDRGGTPRARA